MKFTLEIELGGAMTDPEDVSDALVYVADVLRLDGFGKDGTGAATIRDVNGKTAGWWNVSRGFVRFDGRETVGGAEPRVIHGAVLDEDEIAKDRAALTPEEREVLNRRLWRRAHPRP